MRNKHNGGFSLIEVLVAIVLLGLIVIPISSSMLVAHRINAKTEALLQAELAVSSAAEKYYAGEPITDPSVMITDPGVYGWHTISPVDPDFQALSVQVYGG